MKLNKNIITLIALAGMSVVACGRKDSQSVQDPGPSFSLAANSGTLNYKETKLIELHRDEPSFGPQIQVQSTLKNSVVQSDKKILCPPAQPIPGKTVRAPDTAVFDFRISDEYFPGLALLPLKTECTLEVVLTNDVGSTLKVTIPLILKYDKPGPIEVKTTSAIASSLQLFEDEGEFLLERYEIHNPFNYAIGFYFHPRKSMTGYPAHLVTCPPGQQVHICSPYYMFINELTTVRPSRFELSSNAVSEGRDSLSEMRFRVKPQDTVVISSFGHFDRPYSTHNPGVGLYGAPTGHVLAGIYVNTLSPPTASLTMWRSFELGPEDATAPLPAPISKSEPVSTYRSMAYPAGLFEQL